MDAPTLEQLEQMREEAKALESQTKSLPVLLSVTFIPILVGCGFVAFPEDSKGVLLLGKLWIAGIIIGLMVCSYLSAALAYSPNFRKYWPALLCGLIVAIPPTIASISRVSYGLKLVQWAVTIGVVSCAVGQYLYLKRRGETKTKFTIHYFHSLLAFLVLYAQLQTGLAVAYNFPTSPYFQVFVCAFYPFFAALFRRVCILIVPSSGSLASEILSIYIGSMTYRILTIYFASWSVFSIILALEIFNKFVFYSIQLSDQYLTVRKRVQTSVKRMWLCLPARLHTFTDLELLDEEELLPVPLEVEKVNFHKDVSFLFFLQTHADTCLGLGIALLQLVLMKLVGTDSHDCFNAYFSVFITLTWMLAVVALTQVLFLILFSLFASKVLHKPHFSPIHHSTTKIPSHHVKILVTNVALFFLVFLLFFKSYGSETSWYCQFKN